MWLALTRVTTRVYSSRCRAICDTHGNDILARFGACHNTRLQLALPCYLRYARHFLMINHQWNNPHHKILSFLSTHRMIQVLKGYLKHSEVIFLVPQLLSHSFLYLFQIDNS